MRLFPEEPDLSPTNNLSERRLRRPVLWRGGSFGSDSPNGSRFVERILSTVATLSAQQRNVLDFLMSAHVNHVAGLPALRSYRLRPTRPERLLLNSIQLS